jgi:hypothetical protein
LNARRAGALRRSPLGRRLLIQLVKRSSIDLRRPLGIAPGESAAALAQVLSAQLRRGLPADRLAARAAPLVRRLEALRLGGPEPAWGYHFDVQTRFFFYPRGTPNTIATAFVGLALLDAHQALGEEALLELAVGAGEFFLRRVPQTEAAGGAYFGYLPDDRTPIHNSSLLAAALLAGAGERAGRRDFLDAAGAAVGYAIAHQRDDGSWPYAETPNGRWIDGFHSGYVLDSLLRCAGPLGDPRLHASYQRGLDFYSEHLFRADGAAKYLADSLYPIDSQCVAQGIRTFSLASALDRRWLEPAWRVEGFALARMARPDGAFVFQRRRLWANRAPHVRWVEAPMLEALAQLRAATGAGRGERR